LSSTPKNPSWSASRPLALISIAIGCGDGSAGGNGAEGTDVAALPAPPPELAAMAAELADVCRNDYMGDPAHRAFDPTQEGPHGLLFIAQDGSAHPLNNVVPAEWRVSSADAVELVACVGEVEAGIFEICDYLGTSATVTRRQHIMHIGVVSPQTGARMPSISLGAEPDYCPSSSSTFEDVVGPPLTAEQVKSDVVDRYVSAPTCGASRPIASCLQCWADANESGTTGCGTWVVAETPEILPRVRTGLSVTLEWPWGAAVNPHFLAAGEIDWSSSPDAAVLANLKGPSTSFVASAARSYSFRSEQRMPAVTGTVVERRTYAIDALDRPVIEDVLGTPEPVLARVGQQTSFRFTVTGRSDFGHFAEEARWTWVEKPAGSAADLPSMGPSGHPTWGFTPDVMGTYRLQLEYSDGVGFSEPVTSAPITTLDGPLVDGLVDRQGPVGVPLRLEGFVRYGAGNWNFAWAVVSVPEGSTITPPWFGGDTNSSVIFVPDVVGVYGFEVVVSDEKGQTEPIRFDVTAI